MVFKIKKTKKQRYKQLVLIALQSNLHLPQHTFENVCKFVGNCHWRFRSVFSFYSIAFDMAFRTCSIWLVQAGKCSKRIHAPVSIASCLIIGPFKELFRRTMILSINNTIFSIKCNYISKHLCYFTPLNKI